MLKARNFHDFQPTQKMKFTKTETEYNMKSIRFLLLTITTMFLIIGGLMIVLGLSVYSHFHSFSFLYDSAKSGRFFTPSIMSVLIGMALIVVTSFGFFGSLKKSTCMVNMYALILAIILIFKLVVVIMAFTMSNEKILSYINIPIEDYASDPEIQGEIDYMQTALHCCGSESYLDYTNISFTSNHSTMVYYPVVLPQSCCDAPAEEACAKVWAGTGCRDALINVVVQNSSILGVLGVSVMFIQLLGIIFSLLLARCIRKLKSEKALRDWKVQEQIILARQAEEARKNEERGIYIDLVSHSVA